MEISEEITEEIRRSEKPVKIVDKETGETYYVISKEQYETLKQIEEVDRSFFECEDED